MPSSGWRQISVREDTYRLFQKFRGALMVQKGRKVTEDEALRSLLEKVMSEELVVSVTG